MNLPVTVTLSILALFQSGISVPWYSGKLQSFVCRWGIVEHGSLELYNVK